MKHITPLPDADELAIAPADPIGQAKPSADRKWTVAIVASCLLHAGVAVVFLTAPAGRFDMGDAIQSEGSDQSGTDVAGSALKNADAVDVTLVADPQPARPEAARPIPPPQAPQTPERPNAAEPSPRGLEEATSASDTPTAAIPRDQSAAQNTGTPTPAMAQTQSAAAPPATEPAVDLPVAKPAIQNPMPSALQSQDAGTTDGKEALASAIASKGKNQGASGNAVESGYSNEVQNKLAKANRRVSKAVQEKARGNARVFFVVTADGSIGDLQLVESSGSDELDQFALKLVRQQAPFPPIPAETGKSSWVFRARIGPF